MALSDFTQKLLAFTNTTDCWPSLNWYQSVIDFIMTYESVEPSGEEQGPSVGAGGE